MHIEGNGEEEARRGNRDEEVCTRKHIWEWEEEQ